MPSLRRTIYQRRLGLWSDLHQLIMRSFAQLNLPNPLDPICSPRVLVLSPRNNDKSLCFQVDRTFGNDEVGISIIPCGTILYNGLAKNDNALFCSLEPARVIWYGAAGFWKRSLVRYTPRGKEAHFAGGSMQNPAIGPAKALALARAFLLASIRLVWYGVSISHGPPAA